MKIWKSITCYVLNDALAQSDDIFEKTRIKMVFNLSVIVILLLVLVDMSLIGPGLYSSLAVSCSVKAALIACIYAIKIRKDARLGAKIAVLFIMPALTLHMFFTESVALVNILMFALLIMFAFFSLGKTWGTAIGVCAAAVTMVYVRYFFYSNFHDERIYSRQQIIALTVTIIFGYLLVYLMLKQVRDAQNEAEKRLKQNLNVQKLLNEKFEKLNGELTASNKNLESFTYTVSHDLRAPLRAVNSFADILIHKHMNKMDDEAAVILNALKEGAVKMDTLICDLLAFSRSGSKELGFESVDMNSLVHQVKCEYENNEGKKSPDVIIECLPPALADKALIKQVWYNLVSNAIKYSGKNDKPIIEIGAAKGERENVYYIRDNGVGFDMKHAEKLFTIFHRLHSEAEFKGTGIGLAIVKQIIQRHGGRVWADASKNAGATMYFTLPARESKEDHRTVLQRQ